jgi:hypothetical protein
MIPSDPYACCKVSRHKTCKLEHSRRGSKKLLLWNGRHEAMLWLLTAQPSKDSGSTGHVGFLS